MNLSFPQLLFASVGALLIYAAVTGKNPAGVVKTNLHAFSPGIDPTKTGQASTDGSSGHNMNVGGTQLDTTAPTASGSGRSVHQVYP